MAAATFGAADSLGGTAAGAGTTGVATGGFAAVDGVAAAGLDAGCTSLASCRRATPSGCSIATGGDGGARSVHHAATPRLSTISRTTRARISMGWILVRSSHAFGAGPLRQAFEHEGCDLCRVRQVGGERFGAAAMEDQLRGATQALPRRIEAALDQRDRGAVAAGSQRILGIAGEVDVVAAAFRQLRRALVQRFAHQRRRGCYASTKMAAIGIDEVDG